jgi:hypothetical protein
MRRLYGTDTSRIRKSHMQEEQPELTVSVAIEPKGPVFFLMIGPIWPANSQTWQALSQDPEIT